MAFIIFQLVKFYFGFQIAKVIVGLLFAAGRYTILIILALIASAVYGRADVGSDTDRRSSRSTLSPGEVREFSGSGSGATEDAALSDAYKNALTLLIREEFEVSYSVREEIQATESTLVRSSRLISELGEIELSGVRVAKSKVEPDPKGGFRADATYSVPRSDLELAKARSRTLKLSGRASSVRGAVERTVIGSANIHRANLIVETNPPGAMVTLPDGLALPTPFHIRGAIEPGESVIQIDHPDHDPKTVRFIAKAGGTVTIHEKLSRAEVWFKVETDPPGAAVEIGGVKRGQSPVSMKVQAGTTLDIAVEHPDTQPSRRQIKVFRSPVSQTVKFKLTYKPTYIQIIAPNIAGRFTVKKGSRRTEVPRAQAIQLDPEQIKVCFEPLSKEVARSTQCGAECCRTVDLKPGQLNMIGFHKELSGAVEGQSVIEVDGDQVRTVKSETDKETHKSSSAGASSPSLNLDLPSAEFGWSMGLNFESVSIRDQAAENNISRSNSTMVPTLGARAGLRLTAGWLYTEGGFNFSYGVENSSSKTYTLNGIRGFDGAAGLQFDASEKTALAVGYRISRRSGELEIRDTASFRENIQTRSFTQDRRGLEMRYLNRPSGFYTDLWFLNSKSTTAQLPESAGAQITIGILGDF